MLATGQWWLASQVVVVGWALTWLVAAWWASGWTRRLLVVGAAALCLEHARPVLDVLMGRLPPGEDGWSSAVAWTLLGGLLALRRSGRLHVGGVLMAGWAWMLEAWVPVVTLLESRRGDRLAVATLFAAASWRATGFLATAGLLGGLGLSMDVTTLLARWLLDLAVLVGWIGVTWRVVRWPVAPST